MPIKRYKPEQIACRLLPTMAVRCVLGLGLPQSHPGRRTGTPKHGQRKFCKGVLEMVRVAKNVLISVLWATLSIAALAGRASAQGSRKDDVVFNAQGRPMAGATVRICTSGATGQPCTPLAQIYSDAALTQALANPLSADGLGNYNFYATPGRYMIELSGPGITTKQIPNVILPNDPSSPTFTSVTTTSGISAFSLSLTGNLTVTGSTAVAGALTVGGAPVPSTSADNQWLAGQRFKGPVPHRDVTAYGASGSNQTTTTSAIFTSGSTTLTLTSALDFKNGQGILIFGPGTASALAAPGGLAVVQKGTAGATTYQYQVSCVDSKWGETAANTAVSINNGNATLTYANYNQVTWSASANCIYYHVFGRQSGSMTSLGITANLAWYDYGQNNMGVPGTLSTTPPGAAVVGFYYGTIVSGAGTTTLTMDTASGATTAGGTTVRHDDSVAINAAVAAASTTQDRIFFPPVTSTCYNVTQPITPGYSPTGLTFSGVAGRTASALCAAVSGVDVFLIKNNSDSLKFEDLGFLTTTSATAIHDIQNANVGTFKAKNVRVSGNNPDDTHAPATGIRFDQNVVIAEMDQLSIASDTWLQFGEPAVPIQIDNIHISNFQFYTATNAKTILGSSVWTEQGGSEFQSLSHGLIEGGCPAGSTAPWFAMGGSGGGIKFFDVEFATENANCTGGLFQSIPGLSRGIGPISFDQAPPGNPGGPVFDWVSTGTGNVPFISFRDCGSVAVNGGGGFQIFKTAADNNSGFTMQNCKGVQTLMGLGPITIINGFGVGPFTDGSNLLYTKALSSADQDLWGMDDGNGNYLMRFGLGGTKGGIGAAESTAPTVGAAKDFLWSDSTAHRWKMSNNNGAATNVLGASDLGANLLISPTAPAISSGFGTSPSVTANNGSAAFRINVGTGGTASSGVIGLPTAATGWNCYATDTTTNSASVFLTKQTASTTTTATIRNFNTSAAATAWTASDILAVSCFAF
jgi:hypothetical protein